jgi:hypothetical protein
MAHAHHPMGKRSVAKPLAPSTMGLGKKSDKSMNAFVQNAEQAMVARGRALASGATDLVNRSVQTVKERPLLTAGIALGAVAVLVGAGFGIAALLKDRSEMEIEFDR